MNKVVGLRGMSNYVTAQANTGIHTSAFVFVK